ncbi:MAG: hypothetical protein ACQERD_09685 [Campylobacterota bacterium]
MLENNGVFKIDASCPHHKLEEIHKEILNNINNIKEINVIEDDALESAGLLSLLQTIRKSHPDIEIPLFKNKNSKLLGLGNFVIVDTNSSEV